MTTKTLIKFSDTSPFFGYGFDISADRVVRFNKHADGTYQNTRATYSINKKQFTHFEIRNAALNFKTESNKNKFLIHFNWKFFIAFFVLLFVISSSECSFNMNTKIQAEAEQE